MWFSHFPMEKMQRGWSRVGVLTWGFQILKRTFPLPLDSAKPGFSLGFLFLKCCPKYWIHSIYPKPCQRIFVRKWELLFYYEWTLNISVTPLKYSENNFFFLSTFLVWSALVQGIHQKSFTGTNKLHWHAIHAAVTNKRRKCWCLYLLNFQMSFF